MSLLELDVEKLIVLLDHEMINTGFIEEMAFGTVIV
jgi:hypothetical protein